MTEVYELLDTGILVAEPLTATIQSRILSSVLGDLAVIRQCLGNTFHELGEKLVWMSGQARAVADLSVRATELFGEKESDRAIQILNSLLDDVNRTAAAGESSHSAFRKILTDLENVRLPLSQLDRRASILNTLSVLCRIEQQRFDTEWSRDIRLASDVERLCLRIREHVLQISTAQANLIPIVSDGLAKLMGARALEQQDTHALTGRIHSLFGELKDRTSQSRRAADDASGQYAEVRASVEKIVMSLQAEDIARQQIEHVEETLRHLSTASVGDDEFAGILFLQNSQLESARNLIGGSLRSISENLAAVTARVSSLAEGTCSLASENGENGRVIATSIRNGLSALSSQLDSFAGSAQVIYKVLATTLPSLEEMTNHAAQLGGIEQVVRCTALNALIATRRLGAKGAAMQAISAEIQSVSGESGSHIGTLLGSLNSMRGLIESISTDDAKLGGAPSTSGASSEEIDGLSLQISEKFRSAVEILNLLLEKTQDLSAKTDDARLSLGDPDTFASQFNAPMQTIGRALEELGFAQGQTPRSIAHVAAVNLSLRYSMDSERQVHRQAIGASDDSPNVEFHESDSPSNDADPASSEFGDGIELF
jgi:hypothetical protein